MIVDRQTVEVSMVTVPCEPPPFYGVPFENATYQLRIGDDFYHVLEYVNPARVKAINIHTGEIEDITFCWQGSVE